MLGARLDRRERGVGYAFLCLRVGNTPHPRHAPATLAQTKEGFPMAAKRASKSTPRIDISDLTEAVTLSVQRALAARGTANVKFPWRIIIGIIFDPQQGGRSGGGLGQ
jgi:hypothetical protein